MVAATRSQVCTVLGALLPRKNGAAAASIIRGFGDQLSSTEVSRNLVNYTCLVNKSVAPEDYGLKRKAGRRPRKQNPGFKLSRSYADLPCDDVSIVTASRAEPDDDLLEPQNIRRDSGETEISTLPRSPSTNPSPESITSPPSTLKFGMYAGRVKANPLKYLATVLRSKLQPHDEACNLLQVATEIHDEAKNKHNTTLRRIYDVVNVLEAAGLLERSNGHSSKRWPRTPSTNECASTSSTATGSPSGECSKSAVHFGAAFADCHDEQIDMYSRNPTDFPAGKPNQLEKKAARGSRIRWLGTEAEHERRCHRQTLDRLAEEKIAASQRISEKQLEFEYLQEELRLTTELIKHNQSVIHQSDPFETNMKPCTPPPEDLSYSYLNFEDCSPTSPEAERNPESIEFDAVVAAAAAHDQSTMCGSSSSYMSREFDPGLNPSMITEEDLNFWYNQSASELELDVLEAAEPYRTNGLPLAISGIAKKGLHVPFVILQTNNATNVDIELDGNVTSEVYIVLDNEYKLFDYRELLSSMFPTHDHDREFTDPTSTHVNDEYIAT